MKTYHICLENIAAPKRDCEGKPVVLTDDTIQQRKEKIIASMKQRGLDQLIVYGDSEHNGNFTYLVGYFPRFEEALLVIHQDGTLKLVLGNENLNKASKARVEAEAVHVSLFSLPNQPNRKDKTFLELLKEAGIKKGQRVGIAGWKVFTSPIEENKKIFEVPSFVVDTIREIVGSNELLTNESDLFMGPGGVRATNNANEIAHYEYGAALASDCMLDAMDLVEEGITEQELGNALVRDGQHTNVVTIAASGPRFVNGNMFPTDNTVKIGNAMSLTVGYWGGSSSRAGYAIRSEKDLPEETKDYVDRVAAPYFASYVRWLEEVRIGIKGGEMFDLVEEILPREKYHWWLCPGHLVAEEEWMSSPIYENSQERLKSGMIFQIDIIPSVPGYAGVCAESTVVLADEELKREMKEMYPHMWNRMQKRCEYIKNVLGIHLSKDVLPMCSTVAYLRPFLLNKDCAFISK
ncbi:M24 family metallopeptidase [Lacrimispora sp.]|uniref:M24 family metallopeptidase n=1 Tax=Lacrimispora sp. TaxID=2719234 RepID=UPI0039929B61